MAKKFLTAIDLSKNEIQNAVAQNSPTAPSGPVKGQFYFNSTGGDNTLYWYDGAAWVAAKGGAGTTLGSSSSNQAIGDTQTAGISTDASRADHKHGMPSFGTITAETAFGGASGNGSAVTIARSDHTHGTPTHNNAAHSAINLNALAAPTADLGIGGFKLINVGDPQTGTDATNKQYVDNVSAGLSWKIRARAASTANIAALSGLAAIDGVTPIANDRILVKNQTTANQNGIYLAQSGAWTRSTDADSEADLVNAAVFVSEGTLNQDTAWVQTANAPVTVGTTNLTWVQFAGGGMVTAGAGMTQSGNTLDVIAGNTSLTVAADSVVVGFAGSGGDAGTAVQPARGDHVHSTLYVPVARTVTATAPITGGGALSGNISIGVSTFASGTSGVVPASGGVATNFLSADGTWKAVPLDTTAGDARYINVGGDTMTGPLTLPAGAPAGGNDAANKTYVDTKTGKYAVDVGGSTSQVITHGLNTRDVVIHVYRNTTPWDTIECDIERTTTTTATLRFTTAPSAAEYRAVCVG